MYRLFQLGQSRVQQVIAHMGRAFVGSGIFLMPLCQSYRQVCDILFIQATAFGKLLNHMAIFVASGKVHLGILSGWVGAQYLFHKTGILDKSLPVVRVEGTETSDPYC